MISITTFCDASKWVQGFFVLVQERSRATKTCNLNHILEISIHRILVQYFAWSQFVSYILISISFCNQILSMNIFHGSWFMVSEMDPGFLKTGSGWSNATKSANLNFNIFWSKISHDYKLWLEFWYWYWFVMKSTYLTHIISLQSWSMCGQSGSMLVHPGQCRTGLSAGVCGLTPKSVILCIYTVSKYDPGSTSYAVKCCIAFPRPNNLESLSPTTYPGTNRSVKWQQKRIPHSISYLETWSIAPDLWDRLPTAPLHVQAWSIAPVSGILICRRIKSDWRFLINKLFSCWFQIMITPWRCLAEWLT